MKIYFNFVLKTDNSYTMHKSSSEQHIFLLIFALAFSVLSLQSCRIEQQTTSPQPTLINFANIYNPKATTFFPKFAAYSPNDTSITVYTYLYLPQLAFSNKGGVSAAKVYINIKLTPSFLNRQIIDTVTKVLVIKQNPKQKSAVFPITLSPVRDTSFLINIYIKDLIRRRANIGFIQADRSGPNSDINFLVRYPGDMRPVFGNAIYPDYSYVITHNSGQDTLYAFHYPNDTTLPAPPFHLGGRKNKRLYADTIIKFPSSQAVSFKTPGIYLISTSPYDQHGKTLVLFGPDFPVIHRASEMIPPLVYITTTNEYRRLLKAYSPKLAVDSFWLQITEDPERARELIKAYYNRVFLANLYFTTHKQGWQTDRGMIYIMFGLPQIVHKLDDREIWYYYDYQNAHYIKFVFKKQNSIFSHNDYVLVPDVYYRFYWKRAVQQWRNGIIPSF